VVLEVEVVAKASWRSFIQEHNRKIVREADAGETPGAAGALVDCEALYSSYLARWPRCAGLIASLLALRRAGPR
jgi:hypothetical protein